MTVDVIIPANSKDYMSLITTAASIRSLRSSSSNIQFNVIVVEQNKPTSHPLADKVLNYDFDFNYNKVLNLGLKNSSAKYALLCNNDLIYHTGFFEALLQVFRTGYKSLSPTNPLRSLYTHKPIVEGYGVNHDLMGWCIAVERDMIERIGYFDEGVSFWYSDNLYADQLKHHNIKHARVTNSFVFHIGSGSSSLRNLTPEQKAEYTTKQKLIYENARKKYK
ncbi:MAG: hypothetical protein K0B15_07330 [Lentimicrobium sp.]|nr:hypothetical protein [Lentimicrobium sp.]